MCEKLIAFPSFKVHFDHYKVNKIEIFKKLRELASLR